MNPNNERDVVSDLSHETNTPRQSCYSPTGHGKAHAREARPSEISVTCFRSGNIFWSAVLYRARHDSATRGAVCKQWQVPPRFLRRTLRHRSQAKWPVPIPATTSRPQIWQQDRDPQYEQKRRTTILPLIGLLAFMDNVTIEVLLAPSRPLSECVTRA
jgi:hypothetical protein